MSIVEETLARTTRREVVDILQRASDELAAIDDQSVVLAVIVGFVEDGYLKGAMAHPANGWKTETLADVLSRLGREMSGLSKIN